MKYKVTNLNVRLQSGSGNTVYATWAFKQKNLEHYVVTWTYYTAGSKVGFSGGSSKITAKQSTYSVPSNATSVKVSVKPVSKTYKVKVNRGDPNKSTTISSGKTPKTKVVRKSYWTGTAASKTYQMAKNPPDTPSAPTVTVNRYKLTAILDTQDKLTDKVEFYIISGNKKFTSGTADLNKTSRRASYSCNISVGVKYRVRCRAINVVGAKNVYSEWSEYSSEVSTIPSAVDKSTFEFVFLNETSVRFSWGGGTAATSYEVQYTVSEYFRESASEIFSSSSGVSSVTSQVNYVYITGLEPGNQYYFRVRAVNEQGESDWSEPYGILIATKPAPPTTWLSTTTPMEGESVILYWVHNSEDGSKETRAEINCRSGGESIYTCYVDNERDDEETIGSHQIPAEYVKGGMEVLCKVRTRGISETYSDWSTERKYKVYAPPTLVMELQSEVLESFPFSIKLTPGPSTQVPISYHISITAEEAHESTDATGAEVLINAGEEIHSYTYYPVFRDPGGTGYTGFNLHAGDAYFQNDQTYKVTAIVAMDSGLTAEASDTFTVSWTDTPLDANASIAIVWDTLTALISPFCRDEEENLVPDVTLSVYRREADGSFTEIATDLANDGSVTVTDPHPALDYARYRIAAMDKHTGRVSYDDLPGEPVLESSIVIQWDEAWSEYDYSGEDETELPPWNGSMVWLPWNIDIDENHDPDVSLVEYTGRKHPVSYYGTQQGQSATWSAEIDKEDKDTIYALRRLAAWPGDVYVREPSGTGYWAHVTVSMSIDHCELVVPVSLDVKRVEGGKP